MGFWKDLLGIEEYPEPRAPCRCGRSTAPNSSDLPVGYYRDPSGIIWDQVTGQPTNRKVKGRRNRPHYGCEPNTKPNSANLPFGFYRDPSGIIWDQVTHQPTNHRTS